MEPLNLMRNRPPEIDWRTYLDASLFPFKIFTAVAVVWILCWHAFFLTDKSDPGDFYTFASFVAAGYLFSGAVLLVGGLVQVGFSSRRAWIWSLSFALVALIIGVCMACFAGGIAQYPSYDNFFLAY